MYLQLVLSFIVYKDTNHNNKLYLSNAFCTKYEIQPISKRILNGHTYCNVTEEDIQKIEELSKTEKVIYKRKYVEIALDDERKPAENLFIYYFDIEEKKLYIPRNIYEVCKKASIEIEANPKILEEKNCYSIIEEQLKEIEQKTNYRGIERLLKPKNSQILELNIPPVFSKEVQEIKETPKEEKKETLKENPYPTQGVIIVYKDEKNGKLYIPTKYQIITSTVERDIANHKCYETNRNTLEKIYNKKIIIVSVYPGVPLEYNILVCSNDKEQLFISEENLRKLNMEKQNPHRILINKVIYFEITKEELEKIKKKNSSNLKIKIEIKHIAPIKKK